MIADGLNFCYVFETINKSNVFSKLMLNILITIKCYNSFGEQSKNMPFFRMT